MMAAPGAVLPGLAGDLAHLREHWGIAYVINVATAGEASGGRPSAATTIKS
jgi:hypothetical protein